MLDTMGNDTCWGSHQSDIDYGAHVLNSLPDCACCRTLLLAVCKTIAAALQDAT